MKVAKRFEINVDSRNFISMGDNLLGTSNYRLEEFMDFFKFHIIGCHYI